MTDDEKELWLEGAETFGDAVENRRIVPVMEEGEMDFTVSMPAVKYDKDPSIHTSAKPEGYRQVYWKTFWNKIMEGYNMAMDATSDLTDLKTLIEQTIEEAEAAAQAATEAVEAAENVNADLTGMTVTIVDREGQSKSVNIGFEISEDHVYLSKAAMKADAANVSKGQFCMIANNNPDDEDNATLWSRNAYSASDPEHFPYTFLSDLDQASSAAWADWLENMKPQIREAIAQAASDHTRATTDHSVATQDHNTAIADHTIALQDHVTADGDHKQADIDHEASTNATVYANEQAALLEEWNEHQPYIGDGTTGDANYWYIWSNGQYVKSVYAKGDNLDWDSMTQAEKEALAREMLVQIAFDDVPVEGSLKAVKSGGLYTEFAKKQDKITVASVATCEACIDELL